MDSTLYDLSLLDDASEGDSREDSLSQAEMDLAECIADPCLCLPGILGFEPYAKQQEIAQSVIDNIRTIVPACHASGKTGLAGNLVPWWLLRFPNDAKVITTAPTSNQVQRALWGEVHASIRRARQLGTVHFPEPNLTELRINEDYWAYGFSTNVTGGNEGVKFQGFHGGHILVIFDEALGIHPSIWTALEGLMSAGYVRFLGLMNPTVPEGPAFAALTDPSYNVITISAFDTPNLIGLTPEDMMTWTKDDARLDIMPMPSLVARRWVWAMLRKFGLDHPFVQARILGRFPTQSKFALFPLALLMDARKEGEDVPDSTSRIGIDVAGSGDADTVVTWAIGARVLGVWGFGEADPRASVLALIRAILSLGPVDLVNVDSIGLGYNFALFLGDHFGLWGQGGIVQLVNVDRPSCEPKRFANLKAELYWGLGDLVKDGQLSFEDSCLEPTRHQDAIRKCVEFHKATMGKEALDLLTGQLAGLQYLPTVKGTIIMQSKRDFLKKGIPSPDYAESCMLAFAPNLLDETRYLSQTEISEPISKY
jgi:hypothetical protein